LEEDDRSGGKLRHHDKSAHLLAYPTAKNVFWTEFRQTFPARLIFKMRYDNKKDLTNSGLGNRVNQNFASKRSWRFFNLL